jgi:hypothetical protein
MLYKRNPKSGIPEWDNPSYNYPFHETDSERSVLMDIKCSTASPCIHDAVCSHKEQFKEALSQLDAKYNAPTTVPHFFTIEVKCKFYEPTRYTK